MKIALPVLVGVDDRDRFHVRLATAPSREHAGPSLSEILDDLALDVMEATPRASPAALARYVTCPDLRLRRLKIATELPLAERKVQWTGRLSVVTQSWERLAVAAVPRLGAVWFPVTADLEDAVLAYLADTAPAHRDTAWLDAAVARRDEHLELLEIDTDLPTVLSSRRPAPRKTRAAQKDAGGEPEKDRTWVPPLTLRTVAVSLAHRALDGSLQPAFGRDALVEQVVRELRRPGAAVLLVGPSGVGKTAVIHEVVRRMVDPAATLKDRLDVWELDGNRLIAGMSVVGAWEKRVEHLVAELNARDDVLVVDDLPTLVWTGRTAHTDTNVAGFLEPHLARGELRILGECTPERLAAARDLQPGFFDRFRTIRVPVLDERETLLVALRIARELERDRPVRVLPDALATVLAFNRRFQAHRCQPGAAVTLLRQLVDEIAPPRTVADRTPPDLAGPRRAAIDRPGVLSAIAQTTGLPHFVLDPRDAHPADEIRAWFDHSVLAQPNASAAVVDLVCTLQQGLNDPHRPIATLLLAGPTGVGKTETAKALATWLFGDPRRLVRFDMSELGGPEGAERLVGGAREPEGELTRAIRQQPFAVVLFDEIEKAHPAIFDVLLQVTGEGRLTNAVGRTVDLTSTVVLMTSNLGVADANAAVGFGAPRPEAQDAHYAAAVATFFRPEFVNRLDRVVAYRALELDRVRSLVERLLGELLGRRGLRRAGVLVDVDPGVVDHLVTAGFSPVYGARALKRTLESELTVLLARELTARPPEQRVFVEVYPRAGRLELEVQPLDLLPPPPVSAPLPADWTALRRFHAALVERFHQVQQRPDFVRAMANVASAVAEAEAESDLGHLLAIRDWSDTIGERLYDLEEQLETQYEDDAEVERYRERSPDGRRPPRYERQKLVTVHRPIPLAATPSGSLRSELRELESVLDQLVFHARYADTPPDPVLVRVLPATPDSAEMSRLVAWEIYRAWADWGPGDLLFRTRSGWGRPYTVASDHDGHAVYARVPGLRLLAGAIEGTVLCTRTQGPDTITELARVELFAPSDAPPVVQLEAAEAEDRRRRDARRGGAAVEPAPVPPAIAFGEYQVKRRCLALLPPEGR